MKRKSQVVSNASSADFNTVLRRELQTPRLWATLLRQVRKLWVHIVTRSRRHNSGLRLIEMVGLGEKRFVAVVEYQRQRFLLGGAPASVSLLSQLHSSANLKESLPSTTPERGVKRTRKSASLSSAEAKHIVTLLDHSPAVAQPRGRKAVCSATPPSSIERFA